MTQKILPAIWIIVLIAGLPQFSETVYTPSLPDIAHDLVCAESLVEYTLTIYLFGFAIGTLFWGKISDIFGRKPCILGGIIIFILGCICCYFSGSIRSLMLSRFIQAFGGSIGSVLGQAISRDAFHGPALGKVYSAVGSAMAIFPAIGPVIGGFIAEKFGWPSIFLFLIFCSTILILIILTSLPETHLKENRVRISILKIAMELARDKKVISLGLIVGGCNGIAFSYFAEGSFYLIKMLGLRPSAYGLSFIAISFAAMMGSIVSKKLHDRYDSMIIMGFGINIILITTAIFLFIILSSITLEYETKFLIFVTIASQMAIMFGISMTTSNALAMALVDYRHAIGTASSLFGFFYYCFISLFTLGIGILHNGTIFPMPFYFFGISVFMKYIMSINIKTSLK